MVSLANLVKYEGRYDVWAAIRNRYSLKWSSGNESLQALQRFFDPDTSTSLDGMLQQIRLMIKKTPTYMGKIIKFGVLVGLRSAEKVESVRLINDKEAFVKYYDPEQMTLQHYKFPQFLRTTKKAFLSFVTPEMLETVLSIHNIPSYNAIRLTCQRRGITCDMRFGRKIHATHLHQSGIPVEIIDALQGRTPASIFAKHYYRPSLDYKVQVLQALEKLQKELLIK
jgi:intergrase/recombinase